LEMTKTVFVHRNPFLPFIQKRGDAAIRVAQVLAELYHVAQERSFIRESTTQKLARFVLDMSAEQPKDGDCVRFGLTHEEIGNIIGATRETGTRRMGVLKNRKILVLQHSRLMIHNRSALRHIANAQLLELRQTLSEGASQIRISSLAPRIPPDKWYQLNRSMQHHLL
jgi:CRP/FNR family transcriptional regulator, cyclic AMP receptor protein